MRRAPLALAALLAAGCLAPEGVLPTDAFLRIPRPSLLDQVRVLEGKTNAGRRRALVRILRRRGIPFDRHDYAIGDDAGRRIRGTNLILELGGGERAVLLSAHYDAKIAGYDRRRFEPFVEGDVLPAANDNASCVSALLRAYEILRGRRLGLRVRFVFFDDEEKNLLGSRAYLRDRGLGGVSAVVNAELCGMGDGVGIWPVTEEARGSPVLARLERALGELGIAYSEVGQPAGFTSDHASFRRAGLPGAFTLTAGALAEREAIVAYAMGRPLDPLNVPLMWRNYHTRADTSAHLREEAIEMIARVWVRFVLLSGE